MTVVRTDSGLVTDVASLGPAKPLFLAAGQSAQGLFSGHGVLLGFSAENNGGADSSITAEGAVTGPGAGTTIAQVVLPPGTYLIGWTVAYGAGAVAAVEQNNMQLTGLTGGPLTALIEATAGQGASQQPVTFTGGATIAVKNVAAGTATAVYEAQIVATPVAGAFVRLYDGQNAPTVQVATSFLGPLASDTQWFGDSGIELERGLYVTPGTPTIAVTAWVVIVQDE